MKKYFLTLLFIHCFYVTNAQSNLNVEKQLFKINILIPGIEYEVGLSNYQTLNLRLGTGFALRGASGVKTKYGVFLFFEGQYRWYYNYNRRRAKEKRTQYNSANYLAFSGIIGPRKPVLGTMKGNTGYGVFIGPVYGLQRTYKRGFNFNLEFGIGYAFDNLGNKAIHPKIGFTLGWVLK